MRPEILFPLFAPITALKGVGPRVAPLLERVAGPLVRDLLFVAPQSLIRRGLAKTASAVEGEEQTLLVTVDSHQRPGRSGQPWKIRAFDETGFVHLVFFRGYGAHLEQAHPKGAKRVVSGRIERSGFDHELQIVHPDYLWPAERAEDVPEVEPIYPATAGLPSRSVRRFALEALARAPALPEWQDPAWLERQRWPGWREALQALHHPQGEAEISLQAPARRRLAYDELLAHQLALAQRKASRRAQPARSIAASALADRVEADLPGRR
jgi:ATP-dependent DNA helicase RecG